MKAAKPPNQRRHIVSEDEWLEACKKPLATERDAADQNQGLSRPVRTEFHRLSDWCTAYHV